MKNITIIGLGLIGSSIGMALRKANPSLQIIGHDAEPEVSHAAKKKGAITKIEWNIPASLENAELVIIATPVNEMEKIFKFIADIVPQGCVITDTGSTKTEVLKWASEILPTNVSFVGGHPMAGKELSGANAAEKELFLNRPYCVIPSPNATKEAVEMVVEMIKSIGAEPLFIDAEEHDSLVSGISHLPLIASTALVSTTVGSPGWLEMARLAGSGYRDTTRLASGSTEMHLGIMRSNKNNIIRWIDAYVSELMALRNMINDDDPSLGDKLRLIKEARDNWINGKFTQSSVEMPTAIQEVGYLLFGSLATSKIFSKDRDRLNKRN